MDDKQLKAKCSQNVDFNFVFFQDPALTRRVERLCDTVVKLESFVGSQNETNPVYKDYHGKQVILLSDRFSLQQQRSL